MISIADSFTGQYASTTAFMQALGDQLNIELRQRGFAGADIVEVRWIEEDGRPPLAGIQVRPGTELLNAARLRAWLKDQGPKNTRPAA